MTTDETRLKTLLALRDGEPVDAADLAELEAHGDLAAQVAALDAVRSELRGLPDLVVDDSLWLNAASKGQDQGQASQTESRGLPMLATAASVFLVSMVAVLVTLNTGSPGPDNGPAQIEVDPVAIELAQLMGRSRDLERNALGYARLAAGNSSVGADGGDVELSRTESGLLYRIADVDQQIAQLYEQPDINQRVLLSLWRQRVTLLEDLAAVRSSPVTGLL